MREIGRKGGSARPETALRRAVKEDESLRDLARGTLEKALRGEAVDKAQLDAARSLYSYRAASPPAEQREQRNRVLTDNGRPVTTLLDVLELAIERDIGVISGDPRWRAIARHILEKSDKAAATAANGKEHVR